MPWKPCHTWLAIARHTRLAARQMPSCPASENMLLFFYECLVTARSDFFISSALRIFALFIVLLACLPASTAVADLTGPATFKESLKEDLIACGVLE
jgi:hypothetical protein